MKLSRFMRHVQEEFMVLKISIGERFTHYWTNIHPWSSVLCQGVENKDITGQLLQMSFPVNIRALNLVENILEKEPLLKEQGVYRLYKFKEISLNPYIYILLLHNMWYKSDITDLPTMTGAQFKSCFLCDSNAPLLKKTCSLYLSILIYTRQFIVCQTEVFV